MAQQTNASYNPFLLMMNPEVVLMAIERSERLAGLQRHLCRPLDRPLIAGRQGQLAIADDDDELDDGPDEDSELAFGLTP